MSQHLDVVVRYATSAYQVRAAGKRASSTASAASAAELLGGKVFGSSFVGAMSLPAEEGDGHNVTRWRLAGSAGK